MVCAQAHPLGHRHDDLGALLPRAELQGAVADGLGNARHSLHIAGAQLAGPARAAAELVPVDSEALTCWQAGTTDCMGGARHPSLWSYVQEEGLHA